MRRQTEGVPQHRRGAFIFPILLIMAGVVLLLQTLGVLPWSLWSTLWRFWPVLVILVGLSIILRNAPAWVMPGIALLALAGVVGAAVAIEWPFAKPTTYTTSFSEPLDGLESARVEVDFGAGKLLLGSLPESSENLAEGQFGGSGKVDATVKRRGSEATLKLSRTSGSFLWGAEEEWNVNLSRRVAIDLDLDTGASNVELDLTDLRVEKFTLNAGASKLHVRFSKAAGATDATVKAGAADLDLVVPEGVAARISIDAVLANVNVDETRFPKKGDRYESPGFDTAQNKLTLEIDSGVARITIR